MAVKNGKKAEDLVGISTTAAKSGRRRRWRVALLLGNDPQYAASASPQKQRSRAGLRPDTQQNGGFDTPSQSLDNFTTNTGLQDRRIASISLHAFIQVQVARGIARIHMNDVIGWRDKYSK